MDSVFVSLKAAFSEERLVGVATVLDGARMGQKLLLRVWFIYLGVRLFLTASSFLEAFTTSIPFEVRWFVMVWPGLSTLMRYF